MSLPRLKAHAPVDGRTMNILLDGLEALIGSSVPGSALDTTTITVSSPVHSVRGSGGVAASPTSGAVQLFYTAPPAQYFARRSQIVAQSIFGFFDLGNYALPDIESDPHNEAFGPWGFNLTHGNIYLVHARVGMQAPGFEHDFQALILVNHVEGIVPGFGLVHGSTVGNGILWGECWGIVFAPAVLTLDLAPNFNDPPIPDPIYVTTGLPSENFLEVYCIS